MSTFIERLQAEGSVLKEFNNWYAVIDLKQYYLGRMFLYAKREDASDMVELNEDEVSELWKILKFIKNVAYPNTWAPDIINYAFLGNEVQHCHLHIVPRYKKEREIVINGVKFKDENYGHNYSNPNTKCSRKRDDTTQNIITNTLKKEFMKYKDEKKMHGGNLLPIKFLL